jgi:hypothetical protein
VSTPTNEPSLVLCPRCTERFAPSLHTVMWFNPLSLLPLHCGHCFRGYLKALRENCAKGIQGACQILERHGLHDEL